MQDDTALILYPSQTADRRLLGGKASSLALLAALPDARIPPWFVVPPDAPFSPALEEALNQALQNIAPATDARFAVRSSGVEEDAADHSFAGQFVSFLNVPAADVAARILDVRRSGRTETLQAYRRARGLAERRTKQGDAAPAAVAVLVQVMAPADKAGVAFGADPTSGRTDLCVIAATRGLGDRLAAGDADGETYRVGLPTGDAPGAIERISPTDASGSPETSGSPEASDAPRLTDAPCLTDAEIRRVAALARAVSTHFGKPQDIEWAFVGQTLYLLQSRPITTLPSEESASETTILWDNSNIVESYSGVTTPLTFSFAHHAYAKVYERLARILGVSEIVLSDNSAIFRDLIGLARGRVYYNLFNWYRALAFLPGFAYTRRYMEQMMGVDRALGESLLSSVAPPSSGRFAVAGDVARAASIGVRLILLRLGFSRKIARFHRLLDHVLLGAAPDLAHAGLDQLAAHYRFLESRLLNRWDVPLLNDLYCMVAHGLAGQILEKWGADPDGALRNRLLIGQGAIISAETAVKIREMASMAARDPDLAETLRVAPPAEATAAMARMPILAEAYQAFLERFGDRCLGELKLESPTLVDDPTTLLRAIGFAAVPATTEETASAPAAATAAPAATAAATKAANEADAAAAMRTIEQRLSGRPMRRWAARLILREAATRIRDRENLRFERTRVFGRVRRIFMEIGRRLTDAAVLDHPRMVFYLRVEELLGFIEGTSTERRLQALAALRQQEFEEYAAQTPPPRRFQTRGAVGLSRMRPAATEKTATENAEKPADDSETRRGLGCCPGAFCGRARVICDPRGATLERGDVLVAAFTDPGWVTLFACAGAVVVERGSLLSHSAIVARELGIPAVVGLTDATTWLSDGDIVEVDGATGVVRKRVAP